MDRDIQLIKNEMAGDFFSILGKVESWSYGNTIHSLPTGEDSRILF
jgi:hypothetical protein